MLACITSNGLSALVFLLTVGIYSVIRPVLEYCAVVWHHGLRTEAIEAIQRRAIRIIYPVTSLAVLRLRHFAIPLPLT